MDYINIRVRRAIFGGYSLFLSNNDGRRLYHLAHIHTPYTGLKDILFTYPADIFSDLTEDIIVILARDPDTNRHSLFFSEDTSELESALSGKIPVGTQYIRLSKLKKGIDYCRYTI